MNTIEITTTQNVVIQYQPAGLMDRILAFLVDLVMILVCYLLLLLFLTQMAGVGEPGPFLVLSPYVIVAFYSLAFERFMNGQTIGKKLLNTKVIKVDGSEPEGVDYFKRWSLRLLDIYLSLGSLALISIGSSERGQRLGDKIADTMVIKVQKGIKYNLKQLARLAKSEDYEAKYPEILNLEEKEVLVLKRLLNRSEKHPKSNVYAELMESTAYHLEKRLDIERNKPAAEFIRQLVRDYVVLTR